MVARKEFFPLNTVFVPKRLKTLHGALEKAHQETDQYLSHKINADVLGLLLRQNNTPPYARERTA